MNKVIKELVNAKVSLFLITLPVIGLLTILTLRKRKWADQVVKGQTPYIVKMWGVTIIPITEEIYKYIGVKRGYPWIWSLSLSLTEFSTIVLRALSNPDIALKTKIRFFLIRLILVGLHSGSTLLQLRFGSKGLIISILGHALTNFSLPP